MLYTPISREEFVGGYAKAEPLIDPCLIRIAENDGEVIGFLFALPDKGNRVVLKTLAVLNGFVMGSGDKAKSKADKKDLLDWLASSRNIGNPADAPKPTKSMHIAVADLSLKRLLVVHPGGRTYPLNDTMSSVALADLPAVLDGLQ